MPAPSPQRPSLALLAGVALLMLLAGIAATWPLFSDPVELAPAGIGNTDYWFNAWVVHWGAHALLENPLGIHDANIFWPEPNTFVYSDMELAHSLLVLPVILATDNPALAINVLTLAAIVIGGVGGFALGHRVTGSAAAGFATGLVFVFNDAHFARRLAIQFFGDHWLPWLALATIVFLERRSRRFALVAGLLFVLHALTGSHNAVFGAIVVAVLVGVWVVRSRSWSVGGLGRALLVFALPPLLILTPLFFPYLELQERMAAERGGDIEVLNDGSARPIDLATGASRLHTAIDARLGWPSRFLPGPLRAHLFPGWVPLLLAGIGAVAARRSQGRSYCDRLAPGSPLAWWALGGVCLWLALGPPALLYRALVLVPGLQLIRVPSRFWLPGLLALAVLAGFGAAALARRGSRGRAVLAILLLAFAIESAYAPVETTAFAARPDAVTRWIAEQPGEFAILEIPVDPDNLSAHGRQALFSVHHFKRLLVGYSGWRPPEVTQRLRRIDRRFPARGILNELEELEVRFVIVRESRAAAGLLRAIEQERRLTPAFRDGTVSVWRLEPAAERDVP